MDRKKAEKMVKDLIFESIGLKEIEENSKIEDLCRDSIQIFELIMKFENKFNKKLEYSDICKIETVDDIIKAVMLTQDDNDE